MNPYVVHHVAHIPHIVPHITHGVSYMISIISSLVSAGIGFGLGWYIKGRGMTGVKIDMSNASNVVKADITKLEAKISAPVA